MVTIQRHIEIKPDDALFYDITKRLKDLNQIVYTIRNDHSYILLVLFKLYLLNSHKT